MIFGFRYELDESFRSGDLRNIGITSCLFEGSTGRYEEKKDSPAVAHSTRTSEGWEALDRVRRAVCKVSITIAVAERQRPGDQVERLHPMYEVQVGDIGSGEGVGALRE